MSVPRRRLADLFLAKGGAPMTAPPMPSTNEAKTLPTPRMQNAPQARQDAPGAKKLPPKAAVAPPSPVPAPRTAHGENWHTKTLFTRREQRLPAVATQRADDMEGVFGKVDEANGQLLDMLDRGKGVAKALGARVYHPGESPQDEDYDKPGAFLQFAPPKGLDRARERVETDYNGHWGHVLDVVRASVAVDNMQDMHRALNQMRRDGITIARKPADRFMKPTPAGYRDALINVRLPNGTVGEVQMHLKPILKAKQAAHVDYETMRSIEARTKQEKRPMTDVEKEAYTQALNHSRQVYREAWKKSGGVDTELPPDWNLGKSFAPPGGAKPSLTGDDTEDDEEEASTVQYYQVGNGIVVRWEEGGHPEVFTGDGWSPYPHLTSFAYDAHPIGVAEARHLMYLHHDHDDRDIGEGEEVPDLGEGDKGQDEDDPDSEEKVNNTMDDEPDPRAQRQSRPTQQGQQGNEQPQQQRQQSTPTSPRRFSQPG